MLLSGDGSASIQPGQNTEENKPINNLKPRTFANTMVTSKKVKDFTTRLLFCSNLYDASGMI